MSHINLPPGRWQLVSLRSVVSRLDSSAEPAATALRLGEDTLLPLVARNLASGAVHRLNDGETPSDVNRVAEGAGAALLPAVSAEQALGLAAQAQDSCARERSRRLLPVVREAQQLLRWASTNGRPVDAEVRDTLVAMADVFDREAAGVEDEQKLLKAYEALTTKLAPVSVATLNASMQRLPHIATLFQRKENFVMSLSGMTYGRFFHAFFFVVVLVAAAYALAYQAMGTSVLERHQTQTKAFKALEAEAVKQRTVLRDKQAIFEQAQAGPPIDARAIRLARNDVERVEEELALLKGQMAEVDAERAALPGRVEVWLDHWLLGVPKKARGTSATEVLDSGQRLLDKLNRIVLPMLFGLLGSYSYILRSISIDIRAQQFAPHSALHHIARLSLGALAGIAATWLLTPASFGLAETLPLWALAFVAGYGTELIFAFMDRIVSALKS